jgi:hypothetical protein
LVEVPAVELAAATVIFAPAEEVSKMAPGDSFQVLATSMFRRVEEAAIPVTAGVWDTTGAVASKGAAGNGTA